MLLLQLNIVRKTDFFLTRYAMNRQNDYIVDISSCFFVFFLKTYRTSFEDEVSKFMLDFWVSQNLPLLCWCLFFSFFLALATMNSWPSSTKNFFGIYKYFIILVV